MTSIYEAYEQYLPLILEDFTQKIKTAALEHKKTTSFKLYEHFHARIKTADSMVEKCQRKEIGSWAIFYPACADRCHHGPYQP